MANAVTASYANEAYDPLRRYLKAMQRDDDLMDGAEVCWAKQLLLAMEQQIDAAAPVLTNVQMAAIKTRPVRLVREGDHGDR